MSVPKKMASSAIAFMLAISFALVGCTSNNNNNSNSGGGSEATNELGLIEEGKLICGSDCDYPPFIWLDESGKPVGFEVELMEAIAHDMGLELVYLEPQNFDSLPTVVAGGGKMDLAVSSMTITDVRLETINFCIPYYDSNQAVVTLVDSPYTSIDDLAELTVGAQAGTTGYDWAVENLPNATIKTFNQTSEGMAALRAGEIEALFFDEPVAIEHVSTGYTDCQVMQVIPTGEQYGFAVSKDNPALEAAVNESLQRLIDNGTYAEIFSRYFDFEPTIK
ncbi:MAG: ABC transporter substrate-binding protein [Coriobacteriia bacterium]|nr:ABC transporter substrate-binding protein [Coriobacteriia bacterium]